MRKITMLILFLAFQTTFAAPVKSFLTLEMAKKIADVCEKKAKSEGWREVNIAIYDDGGNLKLFRRQDNAFLHSIKIAKLKGHTSAGLPRTTRDLGKLNYSYGDRPLGIEEVPGFVIFPGGVPIITNDGYQVGGVGVSGATGDQDEECAKVGIAAISSMLN